MPKSASMDRPFVHDNPNALPLLTFTNDVGTPLFVSKAADNRDAIDSAKSKTSGSPVKSYVDKSPPNTRMLVSNTDTSLSLSPRINRLKLESGFFRYNNAFSNSFVSPMRWRVSNESMSVASMPPKSSLPVPDAGANSSCPNADFQNAPKASFAAARTASRLFGSAATRAQYDVVLVDVDGVAVDARPPRRPNALPTVSISSSS